MRSLVLLCAVLGLAWSADVEREVARVRAATPAQLLVTDAYHQALEEAYRARSDWTPAEQVAWQLHLARAAIFAELIDAAQSALQAVADLGVGDDQRPAYHGLLVELWRLQAARDPATVEPVALAEHLAADGATSALLVQAHLAEARRFRVMGETGPALRACDAAVALLADAEPDQRAVAYHARVQTMERAGLPDQEIIAWLAARDDEATRLIDGTIGSAALALIGQSLPALSLPRLDDDGDWSSAAITAPTLLYLQAHWAPACLPINPLISEAAASHPGLQVVCISLHLEGQEDEASRFFQLQALPGILVGDGLGWQSPLLQALSIEAIPQVVLVDGRGRIVDVNLIVGDPAVSRQRLEAALETLVGKPAGEEPP